MTTAPDLLRWARIAFGLGIAGVAACAAGYLYDPKAFFRAWLVAFCFYAGLALGSLVILMLQYLTGGDWGFILRRPLEAATRTMPLVTLFYLPIAFGLPYLYEWADPHEVEQSPMLQHKALYLNVPFTLTRAVIYFGIWNLWAFALNSLSRRMDTKRDPRLVGWCETLSAPGMILYVLTITFASVDWVMSLEAEWFSTIYGAMFGMGQVLSAFAFAIVALMLLSDRAPVKTVLAGNNLRDLGSLLLAFVMVWAYLSFSQFLLIWSGNLPEEVPWYVWRLHGNWKYLALALVFLHFILPFVLLLSTDIKRDRTRLLLVALLIVVMRFIDLVWLIVPAFGHGHGLLEKLDLVDRLMYLAALMGLGGLWVGVYVWQLAKWPLLPEYKPYAEGATHGAVTSH